MFFKILKRALLALPPILFGGFSLHRAFDSSASMLEAAIWLLFAAAMLILLAIQVALPVAGIIGDWCSRIYFPGETAKPHVSYLLAELYEQEHRWEPALAEYGKIIYYHPKELPAHLGRMRIAMRGFDDEKLAGKYLRSSLRRFHDAEARGALQQQWQALQPEIKTDPGSQR